MPQYLNKHGPPLALTSLCVIRFVSKLSKAVDRDLFQTQTESIKVSIQANQLFVCVTKAANNVFIQKQKIYKLMMVYNKKLESNASRISADRRDTLIRYYLFRDGREEGQRYMRKTFRIYTETKRLQPAAALL